MLVSAAELNGVRLIDLPAEPVGIDAAEANDKEEAARVEVDVATTSTGCPWSIATGLAGLVAVVVSAKKSDDPASDGAGDPNSDSDNAIDANAGVGTDDASARALARCAGVWCGAVGEVGGDGCVASATEVDGEPTTPPAASVSDNKKFTHKSAMFCSPARAAAINTNSDGGGLGGVAADNSDPPKLDMNFGK
jgi:hypothetical protein